MDWNLWKLIASWSLFMIAHSLFANGTVKHIFEVSLGKKFRFYRLAYSCVALFSLAGVLVFQYSLPSFYLFSPSILTNILGTIFGLSGAIIMAHCITKYFLKLSGVRISNHNESNLETAGIHVYVRHPLYLGTLVSIWSAFLIWPLSTNLVSMAAITIYTILGIRLEETKLLKTFGKSYELYTQCTPRLIPSFKLNKKRRNEAI